MHRAGTILKADFNI